MVNAMLTRLYFSLIAFILVGLTANAQSQKTYRFINGQWVEEVVDATISSDSIAVDEDDEWVDYFNMPDGLQSDSILANKLGIDTTINVSNLMLPLTAYVPMVYDEYDIKLYGDTLKNGKIEAKAAPSYNPLDWVNDRIEAMTRYKQYRQRYMIDNVATIKYNINTLPEAPKRFRAFVDPSTAHITVEEIVVDQSEVKNTVDAVEVEKRHWLHKFDGLIQFSQAYNSPNWYQGGNNNLNTIIQGVYNIRLNQRFHPKLLFENTIQYKLGLNSAPDDSLRNYSISEDIFQINSKFGIKAANRWYYSMTLQFKTQLLNNYYKNTNDLSASFLSPGELNVGVGLTYDYSTPSGKFKANASLAPLSYNLKICTNERIDETRFGIKKGHTTESQYGSNIDCRLEWKIAHNINFTSRLTAFTNYKYVQGDLEGTLSFSINRFLSTQIYAHLRYDSTTGRRDDTKWHKWQLREVLSFGFAYTFGRL